jgi:hypothetical protein
MKGIDLNALAQPSLSSFLRPLRALEKMPWPIEESWPAATRRCGPGSGMISPAAPRAIADRYPPSYTQWRQPSWRLCLRRDARLRQSALRFWSRARHYTRELTTSSILGALQASIAVLQEILISTTAKQVADFLAQGFAVEILVTNLGQGAVADRYGSLRLEALWGQTVSFELERKQSVGTVTVAGRLHVLHASWNRVDWLPDLAARILAAALQDGKQTVPQRA